MNNLHTPVLFMVFNRPETTVRVFETIRQVRPTKLYVAADGPRLNKNEINKIEEVRNIATKVDWPCDVKTLFQNENLGCKIAVVTAIDWFFKNEREGIILEDDCLPDITFFRYCSEMIERYREDSRIAIISGTNIYKTRSNEESYYFSKRPEIWGWATWRRVWSKYDQEMKCLGELITNKNFVQSFDSGNDYEYWKKILERVKNGKVNTWDAQILYLLFCEGMLSIHPSENLVKNIGFGVEATHTNNPESFLAHLSTGSFDESIVHPKFILHNHLEYKSFIKKNNINENKILQLIKSIIIGILKILKNTK
jgi:hypothetical protein